MPTYEYACRSCGKHHDVVQSFGDDSLTECPACGGPLRKVFGSIGVVFKGSGFYKTDSRATANGKKTDKDAAGTEKTATDGSAKDGATSASSDTASTTKGPSQSSGSSSSSSPSSPPSPSSPSSKSSKTDKTAGTSTAAAS